MDFFGFFLEGVGFKLGCLREEILGEFLIKDEVWEFVGWVCVECWWFDLGKVFMDGIFLLCFGNFIRFLM